MQIKKQTLPTNSTFIQFTRFRSTNIRSFFSNWENITMKEKTVTSLERLTTTNEVNGNKQLTVWTEKYLSRICFKFERHATLQLSTFQSKRLAERCALWETDVHCTGMPHHFQLQPTEECHCHFHVAPTIEQSHEEEGLCIASPVDKAEISTTKKQLNCNMYG
jgi:hypothetical protein